MKLYQLILKNLCDLEKDAFIRTGYIYSYKRLNQLLHVLINYLHQQMFPVMTRVILIAEHNEIAVLFLAAASRLGFQVVMPYNLNNAREEELSALIKCANADAIVYLKDDKVMLKKLMVIHPKIIVICLDDLIHAVPVDPSSLGSSDKSIEDFLVLFTSGTTGQPKAISISEELVCKRILSVSDKLQFNSKARVLMSGLINNTTGIIFSFSALYHGATLIFPTSREVESWPNEVAHHHVSHIMLRPASLARFVESAINEKPSLSSLKMVAYGAASLDVELLEKARKLMPCQWVQGYGLSETFGPFCWLDESDHKNLRYRNSVYCIGQPENSMEFKIDNGELLIKGNMLMRGYYLTLKDPLSPVDDWFKTGDYVELSSDGYLNLKGRINTTLLSQDGHKIYPEEVERLIREINGVDEALLINGHGDHAIKNMPIICITGLLTNSSSKDIREIIISQCQKSLSNEKWPSFVAIFTGKFPTNINDKVDRLKVVSAINKNKLIALSR